MSSLDIGKIKFTWRGPYNDATAYEFDDVVYHDGSAFICVAETPVTASTPSDVSADWDKIAQGSDLGAITDLTAGDMVYFDGTDFTRVPVGNDNQILQQASGAPSWVNGPAVLQQNVYCDRSSRTSTNGNAHYFGGTEFSCTITPKNPNSIIRIDITLFGETNGHNTAFYVQYNINETGWTDMKLGLYGQVGSFKVGSYPDSDYASTPHTYNYSTADQFSTTDPIAFRLIHYNGNTFYYNRAVNSSYESGTSMIALSEINPDNGIIEWR
jgi:hypothetical protein